MSVCFTLDQVTSYAMFRSGTEMQRNCVLDRLCGKLPSVLELPYELAALVLDLSTEIAWASGTLSEAYERHFQVTLPRPSEEKGGLWEFSWSRHPKAVKQVRARHLAFTERNAVLGEVHKHLRMARSTLTKSKPWSLAQYGSEVLPTSFQRQEVRTSTSLRRRRHRYPLLCRALLL